MHHLFHCGPSLYILSFLKWSKCHPSEKQVILKIQTAKVYLINFRTTMLPFTQLCILFLNAEMSQKLRFGLFSSPSYRNHKDLDIIFISGVNVRSKYLYFWSNRILWSYKHIMFRSSEKEVRAEHSFKILNPVLFCLWSRTSPCYTFLSPLCLLTSALLLAVTKAHPLQCNCSSQTLLSSLRPQIRHPVFLVSWKQYSCNQCLCLYLIDASM